MRKISLPDKKPDRTHIDEAIDTLEGGELINELKISKRERKQQKIHSQAKIMQLTGLGHTFIDLMDSVTNYNESYDNLKASLKQRPEKAFSKKNIAIAKVRSALFDSSPRENIDALLVRYVTLLSQLFEDNNKNAMTILGRIITDLLSKQVSFIQDDLKDKAESQLDSEEDRQQQKPVFDYFVERKFAVLNYGIEEEDLETIFATKEGKQVLLSILNVFKPSRKAIDHPQYCPPMKAAVNEYLEGLEKSTSR